MDSFIIKNYIWRCKNFLLSLIGYKTIGVRGLVLKKDNALQEHVLLVKHSYLPQWYHVGGGVGKGEQPIQAMQRELKEEVGIHCLIPPKLFHVYHNTQENRDDYIIFYIIDQWEKTEVKSSEIKDFQWFALTNLPADISPATKRRIEEYQQNIAFKENW